MHFSAISLLSENWFYVIQLEWLQKPQTVYLINDDVQGNFFKTSFEKFKKLYVENLFFQGTDEIIPPVLKGLKLHNRYLIF